MSTTSAYGWNIPDNTDLVKDGALAIRTLGNAIDTSMNTALGTKKAGMVLLNTTSFSGVASQSAPTNTFTSTYRNYRIIFSNLTTSAGTNARFRLRSAGSDTTTSSYYRYGSVSTSGSLANAFEGNTSFYLGVASSTSTNNAFAVIDLINPQVVSRTPISYQSWSTGGSFFNVGGYQEDSTQFDSITIFPDSGNISGTMQIFGYNQ